MRGRKEEIGVQKHIRIFDAGIKEKLDKIMELPQYQSFNQAINDALFYGVPVLYEKLFGEVKDEVSETIERLREPVSGSIADDEFYQVLVRLLKEIVLNATLNKSMLSSIFNACTEGFGKEFASGGYSCTPDYLESYELKGLKAIGGKK